MLGTTEKQISALQKEGLNSWKDLNVEQAVLGEPPTDSKQGHNLSSAEYNVTKYQ